MTFKLTTEVIDEPFIEWMNHVKSNFMAMVQTMIDVAYVVEMHSRKYVPIDTGRLEYSYKYVIQERSSNFIEVGVGYDAVDPKSGFHYAKYQHDELLSHYYREEGDFNTRFRYWALYLENGIRDAKGQSFEMIEKDYLSLFKGV